jgi:hypothetical protein
LRLAQRQFDLQNSAALVWLITAVLAVLLGGFGNQVTCIAFSLPKPTSSAIESNAIAQTVESVLNARELMCRVWD